MMVFGPVPSRRLGRSLGINNIPPKVCTYSCIYCQVGQTINRRANRQVFYKPQDILQAVQAMTDKAREAGEPIDYLILYDGEPTLDLNLADDVEESLLSITSVHPMREDAVREFLAKAEAGCSLIEKLIARGQLLETVYKGKKIFLQKFH